MIQSLGEEEEEVDENEWEEEKLGTATRVLSRRMTILSRNGLNNEPERVNRTNPYEDFSRSNSPNRELDQDSSMVLEATTVVLSAPPSMANLASTLRASIEMDR